MPEAAKIFHRVVWEADPSRHKNIPLFPRLQSWKVVRRNGSWNYCQEIQTGKKFKLNGWSEFHDKASAITEAYRKNAANFAFRRLHVWSYLAYEVRISQLSLQEDAFGIQKHIKAAQKKRRKR
jgi:hypothetical protein